MNTKLKSFSVMALQKTFEFFFVTINQEVTFLDLVTGNDLETS